ncbi:MAG: GntR family transcriptional regulator [Kiritimatiellae bacterium]|nr:GntR family transcriptional regulator [Kiritimatiellia bacterium]MBR0055777.1 GntR family transcriptional regulator [Kiritimatiellia bacterium]
MYGKHGPKPVIQERIARYLKDGIAAGLWSGGGPLPSNNALRVKFRTTPLTVQRAMSALKQGGWIQRVGGDGTFPNPAPPFSGKFLLLTYGENVESLPEHSRPASNGEASAAVPAPGNIVAALKAAERVSLRRGVTFESVSILDRPLSYPEVADTLARMADHVWEGVFCCEPFQHPGPAEAFRSLAALPVGGFVWKEHVGDNILAAPRRAEDAALYRFGIWDRFFDALRDRGLRRPAVVVGDWQHPERVAEIRDKLAARGFSAAPWQILQFDQAPSHRHLAVNAIAAAISDRPEKPDSFAVLDDNLLPPLEEALLSAWGSKALGEIAILCHGNRPSLPRRRLPNVEFHGLDFERMLDDFVVWSRLCTAGRRESARIPGLRTF